MIEQGVEERMDGTGRSRGAFIERTVGVAEHLRRARAAKAHARRDTGTGSSGFRRRRHLKSFYYCYRYIKF